MLGISAGWVRVRTWRGEGVSGKTAREQTGTARLHGARRKRTRPPQIELIGFEAQDHSGGIKFRVAALWRGFRGWVALAVFDAGFVEPVLAFVCGRCLLFGWEERDVGEKQAGKTSPAERSLLDAPGAKSPSHGCDGSNGVGAGAGTEERPGAERVGARRHGTNLGLVEDATLKKEID